MSEAVSFNPATSVYTYRPESVHGSYDIRVKGGIFYTLDKNKYWTVEANLDALFAVNSLTQHHNAYIQ